MLFRQQLTFGVVVAVLAEQIVPPAAMAAVLDSPW
jgi:hypothetical protein